jgi:ABC-type proline/glycine betaine transport system substrate-binding protein
MLTASCSTFSTASPSGSAAAEETDEPIQAVFGDAGGDSMRFHNAVAAFIGETAYHIEASVISGSTAITYTGLKGGDIQVYMETWTDLLATYKDDLEEGSIRELSVNFDDNAGGLYVPRYVIEGDPDRGIEAGAPDLRTVRDLLNYPDLFPDPDDDSKGLIYGAISGWEVDKILRAKYVAYGLDQDYKGAPFGSMPQLLAIAEYVTKNLAICVKCGNPANRTQRTIHDGHQILVGSTDAYEARCRNCHEVLD